MTAIWNLIQLLQVRQAAFGARPCLEVRRRTMPLAAELSHFENDLYPATDCGNHFFDGLDNSFWSIQLNVVTGLGNRPDNSD